jgi:hypothetical protein
MNIFIQIYLYIYIYVDKCTWFIYMYIYIHTYIFPQTYICICIHMYKYILALNALRLLRPCHCLANRVSFSGISVQGFEFRVQRVGFVAWSEWLPKPPRAKMGMYLYILYTHVCIYIHIALQPIRARLVGPFNKRREPTSSEYSTCFAVKDVFWPQLSGLTPYNPLSHSVDSSLGSEIADGCSMVEGVGSRIWGQETSDGRLELEV